MANTFTKIHIHFIFAVKYRRAIIGNQWKDRLHQYTTGIIQNNDHKLIQVNSMPDHIHFLVGLRPTSSISSLIQNVKCESSKWINDNQLTMKRFAWQEGFGAFSYAESNLPSVIRYIQNQEHHHKKQTFLQEYKAFLKAYEIVYDEKYIFKELE